VSRRIVPSISEQLQTDLLDDVEAFECIIVLVETLQMLDVDIFVLKLRELRVDECAVRPFADRELELVHRNKCEQLNTSETV
jgi:hypothetical protein